MTTLNKRLFINDVDLSTYGIYCFNDSYLNGPSIDYSEFEIPSRTGIAIKSNKRLNNVVRSFSCICRSENFDNSLLQLKRLLYQNEGYLKLQSDYQPNFYQFGFLSDEINVTPHEDENTIIFDLTFSCNPKKYYNEVDVIQTQAGIGQNANVVEKYSIENNGISLVKYIEENQNLMFTPSVLYGVGPLWFAETVTIEVEVDKPILSDFCIFSLDETNGTIDVIYSTNVISDFTSSYVVPTQSSDRVIYAIMDSTLGGVTVRVDGAQTDFNLTIPSIREEDRIFNDGMIGDDVKISFELDFERFAQYANNGVLLIMDSNEEIANNIYLNLYDITTNSSLMNTLSTQVKDGTKIKFMLDLVNLDFVAVNEDVKINLNEYVNFEGNFNLSNDWVFKQHKILNGFTVQFDIENEWWKL